jgi:ABC-type transport system involved in cytochrome c biogenesis permease component
MERLLLQDLKLAWKNGRNINTKLRFAVAFLCLMLAVRIGAGNAGLA